MPKQQAPQSPKRRWGPVSYRVLSIPVSTIAILIVYFFQIPNPMMLLMIPVVFFTYSEGYVSGAISGVTAVLYSAYFFFFATADRAAGTKFTTIVLAVLAIVLLMGRLKSRDNRRFAELCRTQEQLVKAKEEAEQLSRVKSNFLSTMSHEIRTPMNAIIGMSAIARKSGSLEKISYCLNRIDDASEHLLGVINDILDMSKIEAGKFELSPSDFTVEHMLSRIINVNQIRFEQKMQDFSVVVDPGVPTAIVSDEQRLSQVITNLLSNAAKFTPNEGRIELSIHLQEETPDTATLRFEVKDEGIGMTEEQQSRLFQAFEQADNSITRRFGGTGLGLAISKNIVEMMNGRIWVTSAPGKGSDFLFEICAKKGSAAPSIQLSSRVDRRNTRFLVVDDSESVRRYFGTLCDSLGVSYDTAGSAGEALLRLRERTYQMIFVDWLMPGSDGLSLARSICDTYGDQILVMMSASDWSEIEAEAWKVGVRRFLTKPLLPSPLVECINLCLGDSQPIAKPGAAGGSSEGIFRGKRLLLVEDIEINREIMKDILEETGIEVIEAENGQAACEIFEQNAGRFDLILMDVHMPLMDGYTATRTIRNKTRFPEAASIPILAMTADVLEEDIRRCTEAGMNAHIGKPVDVGDLLSKMKQYLFAK